MVLDRQLRDFARDPDPRAMPAGPTPETVTGLDVARTNLQRLPASVLSGTGRLATSQLALAPHRPTSVPAAVA
jgi:hypothetical protein